MRSADRISIYPRSNLKAESYSIFLAREEATGERYLGVRSSDARVIRSFSSHHFESADAHFYSLNAENAARLRQDFAHLRPARLETASSESGNEENASKSSQFIVSFGFGDRLGLATPGHIHALEAVMKRFSGRKIAPIFAQQSVRENARTGRTPQQVIDEAMWGILQEGWRAPWGADADHLKAIHDLPPFVESGYSFFTVDPGEYVDASADTRQPAQLHEIIDARQGGDFHPTPEMQAAQNERVRSLCAAQGWVCDEETLQLGILRAAAKYGHAVQHVHSMYQALQALKPEGFDFEVSVDETDSPTSVLEHFYIASELKRLEVRFTSLAPRLPGRFEKGVDYIGDRAALEAEIQHHAAVMRFLGGYKLSLHSGSDKFSVYPLLARHAGRSIHVKTAGTSYLEGLRVAAQLDPLLFRQVFELARQRYSLDRQSYHVSAELQGLPASDVLPNEKLIALLDDFNARQALHVTYGSALAKHGAAIKALLRSHPYQYEQALAAHFQRHLEPLITPTYPEEVP